MSIAFPDIDLYVWPWKLYLFIINMFLRQDDKVLVCLHQNWALAAASCYVPQRWCDLCEQRWRHESLSKILAVARPIAPSVPPCGRKGFTELGAYRTPPGKRREKQTTGSLVSTMGSRHSGLARRYLAKDLVGTACTITVVLLPVSSGSPREIWRTRCTRLTHVHALPAVLSSYASADGEPLHRLSAFNRPPTTSKREKKRSDKSQAFVSMQSTTRILFKRRDCGRDFMEDKVLLPHRMTDRIANYLRHCFKGRSAG